MMNVILNGTSLNLEGKVNIESFLEESGYENKIVAVAINGDFVPKSAYGTHMIGDNDAIEIVAPMQGG